MVAMMSFTIPFYIVLASIMENVTDNVDVVSAINTVNGSAPVEISVSSNILAVDAEVPPALKYAIVGRLVEAARLACALIASQR